ncbi:MAG: hypothetical protein COW01_07620 [Bdellovibrionales bacterium CG12_big_fil_rev_8_21_14_0_65_38_15]|nr:MAG: hypothetical protein COW79_11170 [Bdellovibrionales bacterium CG22_combo_CG10-13_8_21_14_all_38_13]PIQ55238.1 MAG: hypothetical protein COW01_07620 [Bdellovibrionales bacterium CG12_big_fil_rev_8_21_14_0_65_38_15]PIR30514.1 MAG: hypothetical protein COV38_05030 [Bdellovibrionales bacterium CG11_big_fil_rev_8_21_14_0_20_38_13]
MKTIILLGSGVQDYQLFDTASQNEALINEFKGNLFEYLVGLELAKSAGCEAHFLSSIQSDLTLRLRSYEDWLWQNDSDLAEQLPRLAKSCADYFKSHYSESFEKVLLVGKIAGGSHDQSVGEADLLLIDRHENTTSISLKLCRTGAYVNTKSAGIRSFLSKYFSLLPNSGLTQERLNLVLDESFKELSRELHRRHGLEEEDQFSKKWMDANLPVLPGALNELDQSLMFEHYFRVISIIADFLKDAFEKDQERFNRCVGSILGFANKDQIQVICYHREVSKKKYQWSHCEYTDFSDRFDQLALGQFQSPKKNQASLSIEYPFGDLQIRVKPMNKFTVAALKVNCSVRSRN